MSDTAKWADPFYIFGLGAQLILIFYLIYLAAKLYKYLRTARKFAIEPEAAGWARVVMDPLAPRRPTEEMVKKVTAGIADTQGRKRVSPWVRRGMLAGTAVLIGALLFNMGVFAPLFDDSRETTTLIVYPLSVLYVTNVSACQVPVITQMLVGISGGGTAIIWFDDKITELSEGQWYEITIADSMSCSSRAATYYSLLDWRKVEFTDVAPPS